MVSRSLLIDRSLQARKVVFTPEQYNALPHNRVDLDGYDTKYSQAEEQALIKRQHYTPAQKRLLREAQQANRGRDWKDLMTDLRTTENVQPLTREGVDAWKEDKKNKDIQNIDTQPAGLIGVKSNIVRKNYTPVPRPKRTGMRAGLLGSYSPLRSQVSLNKNYLHKRTQTYNMTFAHEIGHAYDHVKTGFAEISQEEREELKRSAFRIDPVPENAGASFRAYRHSRKEIFADYFSALVENPAKTRKESPTITGKLLKMSPNLFKEFRMAETSFLKKHITKLKI